MCKNTYNFGQRLKQIRLSRGISQAALANKINVSKETIYRYENNIKEPSLQTVVRLAQFFETSVDALVGMNDRAYLDVSHLSERQRNALEEFLKIYPCDSGASR